MNADHLQPEDFSHLMQLAQSNIERLKSESKKWREVVAALVLAGGGEIKIPPRVIVELGQPQIDFAIVESRDPLTGEWIFSVRKDQKQVNITQPERA